MDRGRFAAATGTLGVARTRTGGRWLWIDGSAVDPRTIEIVRLDDADVAAASICPSSSPAWMYDQTRPDPIRP